MAVLSYVAMLLNKTPQPFCGITLAGASPQRIARALAHNSCRLSMPECGHLKEIITYSTTFALPQDVSSQSCGQPLQKSFGTDIAGSCHKYNFCHDKTRLLLRQKYACRNKTFVTTNTFVVTNICCDKRSVSTKVLSRQAYFCYDKRHCFVTKNTCLSQQK